jgi:hypothetical protein
VVLKVWLPQSLVDRLNWLSAQADMSRVDVIRVLIFKHLYGEVGYEELVPTPPDRADAMVTAAVQQLGRSAVPSLFPQPMHGEIRRSPARLDHTIDIQYLGESSTNSVPVELSRTMADDLGKLAQAEGLSKSQCVRKLLVLKLMGAVRHATWQRALGPISTDVLRSDRENEGK